MSEVRPRRANLIPPTSSPPWAGRSGTSGGSSGPTTRSRSRVTRAGPSSIAFRRIPFSYESGGYYESSSGREVNVERDGHSGRGRTPGSLTTKATRAAQGQAGTMTEHTELRVCQGYYMSIIPTLCSGESSHGAGRCKEFLACLWWDGQPAGRVAHLYRLLALVVLEFWTWLLYS